MHALPCLHAAWWALLLAAAGLALSPGLRILALALAGLGVGAWHIETAGAGLDGAAGAGVVTGRIADLPRRDAEFQRFEVVPEHARAPAGVPPAPWLRAPGVRESIRLVWHGGDRVAVGERWRFETRLRAARGHANRGGFDAERWYRRAGVVASGYVVSGSRLDGRAGIGGRIDGVRHAIRERIRDRHLVHGDVIAALTVGDGGGLDRQARDLYRRTGTMHLLVISGLHIGMVTGIGLLLGRAAAFAAGVSRPLAGGVGGLALGGAYVLLGGAGLPLVRAFIMAAVAIVGMCAGRSARPLRLYAVALAIVLLTDPMAPLDAGFWLSFGAVGALLAFFAPRTAVPAPRSALTPAPDRFRLAGLGESWIGSAVRVQATVAVVLAPVTAAFIGHLHPLATLTNLVAVPLVTVVVTPLSLAGAFLPWSGAADAALVGADYALHVMDRLLNVADRVTPVHVSPAGWRLALALALACLWLLPISRLAGLAVAATVALLVLAAPHEPPPPGEVEVTAFDVGQGTAVLVRTRSRALLYDAGPAYASGGDAGATVVLPELRRRGVGTLHRVVVSHADTDHAGGVRSVLDGVAAGGVLVGEAVPGVDGEPCRAGQTWNWDGVSFAVLHPPAAGSPADAAAAVGNAASCVLLVEARGGTALLPGDIDSDGEAGLDVPGVDFLVVAHHGSATSTSAAFVARSRPAIAVISNGFDNRFGHPHRDVVRRLRDAGAHVLSTAASGAVRWSSARPGAVERLRCRDAPWWRRDARGVCRALN